MHESSGNLSNENLSDHHFLNRKKVDKSRHKGEATKRKWRFGASLASTKENACKPHFQTYTHIGSMKFYCEIWLEDTNVCTK